MTIFHRLSISEVLKSDNRKNRFVVYQKRSMHDAIQVLCFWVVGECTGGYCVQCVTGFQADGNDPHRILILFQKSLITSVVSPRGHLGRNRLEIIVLGEV